MGLPDKNISDAFEEWWARDGFYIDPDTSDVPWFDKRKGLAELAFAAAYAQSGNYVANDDTFPSEVTFSNGRIVRINVATEGLAFLEIEKQI